MSFSHNFDCFRFFPPSYSAYDSGSPIIIRGESVEDDLLVALVSWGEECADAQFPGKCHCQCDCS